jgi:AP-2 complex subunit alpha
MQSIRKIFDAKMDQVVENDDPNGTATTTQPTKPPAEGRKNAYRGILIETVKLVVNYGGHIDENLKDKAFQFLGQFILEDDVNVRYLGLDGLAMLAKLNHGNIPNSEIYLPRVIASLQDVDVSIRKRALDVLYITANKTTSKHVVSKLIESLAVSDAEMKSNIVVKIAILAENHIKANVNDSLW